MQKTQHQKINLACLLTRALERSRISKLRRDEAVEAQAPKVSVANCRAASAEPHFVAARLEQLYSSLRLFIPVAMIHSMIYSRSPSATRQTSFSPLTACLLSNPNAVSPLSLRSLPSTTRTGFGLTTPFSSRPGTISLCSLSAKKAFYASQHLCNTSRIGRTYICVKVRANAS